MMMVVVLVIDVHSVVVVVGDGGVDGVDA